MSKNKWIGWAALFVFFAGTAAVVSLPAQAMKHGCIDGE